MYIGTYASDSEDNRFRDALLFACACMNYTGGSGQWKVWAATVGHGRAGSLWGASETGW